MSNEPTRFARIYCNEPRIVAAYLPANYTVIGEGSEGVLIVGKDSAGWTLQDYVLPRLASGLWFGRELSADDYADALNPDDLRITR